MVYKKFNFWTENYSKWWLFPNLIDFILAIFSVQNLRFHDKMSYSYGCKIEKPLKANYIYCVWEKENHRSSFKLWLFDQLFPECI